MKIDTAEAVKLISSAVDAEWKSGQKPILLSQIGSLEQGKIVEFIKSSGVSLKKFISSEMNDKYRVEHHSENKAVIGIFPRNTKTTSVKSFDQFFDYKNHKAEKKVRIKPVFWAAFKKPLNEGMNRYILFEPKQTFEDIKKTDAPPPGGVSLPSKYIVSEKTSDDNIFNNISKWLEEQQFSIEKISQGRNFDKRHPKLPPNANLLEHILVSLTVDELKRVSIPLDVLKKLYFSKL